MAQPKWATEMLDLMPPTRAARRPTVSLAPALRVVISLYAALIVLFVALRAYARLVVKRNWGIDDYFCILATMGTGVYLALIYTLIDNPLGPHVWDVPFIKVTAYTAQVCNVTIWLYTLCSLFLKLSLFALYIRLFRVVGGALMRSFIYGGMALVTGFYTACFVGFLCLTITPPGKAALKTVYDNTQARDRLNSVQAAGSAVTNFFVWMLPLPALWRLNLPLQRKAGVVALLISGLIACACSVASSLYRVRIIDKPDVTWTISQLYLLSIAELSIGIMCACVPAASVTARRALSMLPRWPGPPRLKKRRANPLLHSDALATSRDRGGRKTYSVAGRALQLSGSPVLSFITTPASVLQHDDSTDTTMTSAVTSGPNSMVAAPCPLVTAPPRRVDIDGSTHAYVAEDSRVRVAPPA